LPFRFKDCGRWWGTNPRRRAEQEIDVLAHGRDKDGAIFCECKWTNEKISESLIDELIDKSDMFGYEKRYYYLFSKSGFTPAALARASDTVRPVCFDDMF
jgi:hypothetical protein